MYTRDDAQKIIVQNSTGLVVYQEKIFLPSFFIRVKPAIRKNRATTISFQNRRREISTCNLHWKSVIISACHGIKKISTQRMGTMIFSREKFFLATGKRAANIVNKARAE